MKKHTHTAATWHKMAAAHTSAAAEQSAGSSTGRRRLGSSSMRPRVVHGDGFTCSDDGDVARLATRPRVDHGGGTRLVNDGVVEQRGVLVGSGPRRRFTS